MQPQLTEERYGFEFTGEGKAYFKIWIVNLLLSIVTLGIYSPWAKVRRLQYFYRNTRLADASFDYHGTPMAILKGRLIALGLFIVYNVAFQISIPVGVFFLVVIALVMPWLLIRSLGFRLYNSSYRGLRFSFTGELRDAYKVFLLNPVLAVLTAYLMAPFAHHRIKNFQHNNSWYGNAPFRFNAETWDFYRIYLEAVLIYIGLMFVIGLFMVGVTVSLVGTAFFFWLFLLGFFAFLAAGAYFMARMQNLIWNSTSLDMHEFYSELQVREMMKIVVTNFVAILLTLGLFTPFAQVRLMKYKLACMGLNVRGDFSAFIAGQQQEVNATGEETAEMFDLDLAL